MNKYWKPVALAVLSTAIYNQASSAESSENFITTYINSNHVLKKTSCMATPVEAKAAINAAIEKWSNHLKSSIPIRVSICWSANYSDQQSIVKTYPNTHTIGKSLQVSSLANAKVERDLSPLDDIYIIIDSRAAWSYGIESQASFNGYNLMSTILREMSYGLGVFGNLNPNDNLSINNIVKCEKGRKGRKCRKHLRKARRAKRPTPYDRLLIDGSGKGLTKKRIYPRGSSKLETALTSSALWFNGESAIAANDGRSVRICQALDNVSATSSYFDDALCQYNSSLGRKPDEPDYHQINPITLGILEDIGWQVSDPIICPPISGGPISGDPTICRPVIKPCSPISGGPISGDPTICVKPKPPITCLPISGGPISGDPTICVKPKPPITCLPISGGPISGDPTICVKPKPPITCPPISGGPISGDPTTCSEPEPPKSTCPPISGDPTICPTVPTTCPPISGGPISGDPTTCDPKPRTCPPISGGPISGDPTICPPTSGSPISGDPQ